MRSAAKAPAPNEPKLRANVWPRMGKVQRSKRPKLEFRRAGTEIPTRRGPNRVGERNRGSRECSVVSHMLSGDPKGSARDLRNGERTTGHEPRIDKLTAGAEVQRPNEPTASQAQGHNREGPGVASIGG